MSPFDQIKRHLRNYKIDDALVFLNYLLYASKDPSLNSEIHDFEELYPGTITDFKIEFFSKWLIICSEFTSNLIYSSKTIDWPAYLRLSALFNEINDPFVTDRNLNWETPLNLIVRMHNQQLPGQQRIGLQSYGSASLLYDEAGRDTGYNLSSDFKSITGLTIIEFMHLGMVLSSARSGPFKTPGTLNQDWLDKGYYVGIDGLKKDNIRKFLTVASCDYNKFRSTANNFALKIHDTQYSVYEFNPLTKYPFIKVHPERWVAPNPNLVTDRSTFGIYYDLLDNMGKSFTDRLGHIFEVYIGILLRSVYPKDKVLKEKEYLVRKNRKRGPADWTILENRCSILIECKSFIPNIKN